MGVTVSFDDAAQKKTDPRTGGGPPTRTKSGATPEGTGGGAGPKEDPRAAPTDTPNHILCAANVICDHLRSILDTSKKFENV